MELHRRIEVGLSRAAREVKSQVIECAEVSVEAAGIFWHRDLKPVLDLHKKPKEEDGCPYEEDDFILPEDREPRTVFQRVKRVLNDYF